MCFIFRFLVILRPSAVKCAFPFLSPVKHDDNIPNKLDDRLNRAQVSIGPCKWIFNEKCPHSDIRFYLYTRKNPQDRQLIHVDEAWDKSNLSGSNFNPNDPTKIILHGYNSDMFLTPLIQMKGGMTILPTIRWLSLPETVLQLLTFWTLLKVLHWSAIQFVRNLLFEITVSMRLMTRTHEKLEQLCSSLASFSVVVSFSSMQFIPFPLSFVSIAYFDRGSYNLFFVDWSELARAPCYPSAVHNTKYAGECIGQLVNRIRDAGSENIHIIGFSLGAHVGKRYTVCSNNTRKLCDFINYEPSADWYVLAGLSKCVIDIYDSQIRQAYIRSHKVTFISWRNLLNTTQSDNIHLPHEFCFNYCFFLSINIWFLSFFMEWDFYCAMIKVKNKMLVNCLQLWKNDKAEQSSNSIYI